MYLAVGFSTTNELGCAQVMVVLPADKSFSYFLFFFMASTIEYFSKSFPSSVSFSRTMSNQHSREQMGIVASAIDETQFVYLNFELFSI